MRTVGLVSLLAIACAPSAPTSPTPVVVTPTAPAAPTPAEAQEPEDLSGRRLRLRLALTGDSFCQLMGIAPIHDGAAWISGDCNLRAFVDDRGTQLHLASSEVVRFGVAGYEGDCNARWLFPAIVASGRGEAVALAEQRCGMDPNTMWQRSPQRFDGSTWRPIEGRAASQKPWHLIRGRDGVIWGMAPEETSRSANDLVFRWRKGGWESTDFAVHDHEVIEPVGMVVAADGSAWLPDRRATGVWRGSEADGWTFVALPNDNEWTHDVVLGEDGAPYVVGDAATLRWNGEAFERVAPGGSSAWPRSARDVVIATHDGQVVRHRDGQDTPIAIERGELVDVLTLRAAGGHLWALGRRAAWSLSREDAPLPAPRELSLQMFDE